jgi:hypothetical protein
MAILKFRSKVCAEIIMLEVHAKQLFNLINIPCSQQGSIMPEQLPTCIDKLKIAIAQEKDIELQCPLSEEEEAALPKGMAAPVRLQQRAYPLLRMMQESAATNTFVYWGF